MQFLSLEPFVPSGPDFEKSKQLFLELGFRINWDAGDYAGFQKDQSKFILQKFDNRSFAENFMISVHVNDLDEFWQDVSSRKLAEKFGVRFSAPAVVPYGREVNLIDGAGVCWHFIQS